MTREPGRRRILIAGQAKTGTTALFYSIQASLSDSTYCLFEPDRYAPPADETKDVLAKVLIGTVKPAKIETFEEFERKILIIRDPRDTLVSSILYSVYHSENYKDTAATRRLITLLETKEANPSEISLHDVMAAVDQLSPGRHSCLDRFLSALKLFTDFYRSSDDYHHFHYDDLVTGNLNELEDFLVLALPTVAEVVPEKQRVTRTKSSGDWKNWLTDEDIELLRPVLEEAILELGYENDWSPSTVAHIRPEHGSLYVQRLLSERRHAASFHQRARRGLNRILPRWRQTFPGFVWKMLSRQPGGQEH